MRDSGMAGPAQKRTTAMLLTLVALGAAAQTHDRDAADGELLEFLGSWESEDEDWIEMTIEDLQEERRTAEIDVEDEAHAGADDDED